MVEFNPVDKMGAAEGFVLKDLNNNQNPATKVKQVFEGKGADKAKGVTVQSNTDINLYGKDIENFEKFGDRINHDDQDAKKATMNVAQRVKIMLMKLKHAYPDMKVELEPMPDPKTCGKGREGFHAYIYSLEQWEALAKETIRTMVELENRNQASQNIPSGKPVGHELSEEKVENKSQKTEVDNEKTGEQIPTEKEVNKETNKSPRKNPFNKHTENNDIDNGRSKVPNKQDNSQGEDNGVSKELESIAQKAKKEGKTVEQKIKEDPNLMKTLYGWQDILPNEKKKNK